MSEGWPRVRLGEVLRHRKEFITIDDTQTYKRPRVQLHAQGIVLRDEVPGALIKTKTQQVCRAGEFLVAEIDAKHGGFGLVPPELEGAIVSSHYFLFEIDQTKLDPAYLGWFSKTPAFRDQVEAQGTTNYAAIRPSHVLGYDMPLPPLAEQARIVERINSLSQVLASAEELRVAADFERAALCRAILASDNSAAPTPLSYLVDLRKPDVRVAKDGIYQFAGVYSFGRGVFRAARKSGGDFAYPMLTTLRAGDFVYPKLMAWEGAFGVVPPDCDGCVVSTEFPVFSVRTDRVLADVLDVHFRDPAVWPAISGASTGTNVRRRRLNPQDFLAYRIPLPSRTTQEKLVKVRSALRTIETSPIRPELGRILSAVLDRTFSG